MATKKKKKRFIGPTIEAASLGLATASEGKLNTPQPGNQYERLAPSGPSQPSSSLGLGGQPLTGPEATPEPLDVQIANESTAKGAPVNPADYGSPQTPEEEQVQNIILGYFQVYHRLPSADKTMMLMQQAIPNGTPETYAALWKGGEDADIGAGDFFQDTGYETLHGMGELLAIVRERKLGVKEVQFQDADAVTVDTVKEHLRYQKGFKAKRAPDVWDAAGMHDPEDEMRTFSTKLADRYRRRGAPVEWDEEKPWGDPNFIKASMMYAMGRQWAFSLGWSNDNEDMTRANEVITYLASRPENKAQMELMGEQLGVGDDDWTDEKTIGAVIDAMRLTDDENTHAIVYDGWMLGRPIGQSPSQARFEFARKFGVDRLPAAERQKYEESANTVMGAMSKVTDQADRVWEWAKDVPVIGDGLAAIGGVSGKVFYALNWPIEKSMQFIVTAYDIANQMDRGMTTEEYQDALRGNKDFDDDFGWNWSIFTDTAAWAQAWEEAEGKTPIAEMMQTISLDMTGKETAWAKAIGELTDFSIMMYVGAKMDPVVRGGAKMGADATFIAGRATEKYLSAARVRYGGAAAETGEWIFRVGKEDMGRLPKPAQKEIRALHSEYRALESDYRNPGDPSIDAAIRKHILDNGGINLDLEGTAPFVDSTLKGSERTAAFRGLGRRGKGVGMDELADSLQDAVPGSGIRNSDDLSEWLQKKRSTGKVEFDEEAQARADAIEERVAAVLRENGVIDDTPMAEPDWMRDDDLLDAPDRMFDADQMIGEGQQAGLDIAVDATARKTDHVARMPERGPEQMPGQTAMDAPKFNIGDEVTFKGEPEPGKTGAPSYKGKVTEIDPNNGDLKVQTADGEVWANPNSTAKVDAQGVKVAQVETKAGPVDVDASIAEPVQRLNDGGFKTHQSHSASAADHPSGHPTMKENVKPYVEFAAKDLSAQQIKQLTAAAKRLGLERDKGKATIDGAEHSTIIIRGDVAKLADDIVGPTKGPEGRPYVGGEPAPGTQEPIRGDVTPPEGPTTPSLVSQSQSRWMARFFRTNAEVVATVDDEAFIGRMYDIPEGDLAAKRIVRQLAGTKNVDDVERLLRKLEEHGVEIDGGAGAVVKNMRQAAYRNGFAYRSPARIFVTSTMYGRRHSVDGASDMMFNVAVASKMGRVGPMSKQTWDEVRALRRKVWDADRPMQKQAVLDEFWTGWENNLGPDGLAKFNQFKTRWYKAQGRTVLASARGTAYYGEIGRDGLPVEGSKASAKNRARTFAEREVGRARAQLREYDEFNNASASERARIEKALGEAEKKVKDIEKASKDIDALSGKEALSDAERKRLRAAEMVFDEITEVPVPLKLGQSRSHLVHKYDPRMVGWYMAGDEAQMWGLFNEAVAEPVVKLFKETVMSAMGFPLRVNIGDEAMRLIPEGTLSRYRTVRKMKKELKSEGVFGGELGDELHDRMAYDWVTSDSGNFDLIMPTLHPRGYHYLQQDLYSWAREPFVKRIVAQNGGEFPADFDGVRGIVDELRQDPVFDLQMREFLDDTYRSVNGRVDDAAYEQWLAQWDDRLTVIASNPTLRRAMTGKVTPDELKQNVPKDILWPINAPEDLIHGGSKNPLYALSKLNLPYHYVYNGVNLGKSGKRIPGTVDLLGGISNKIRETVFADRYYIERKAAIANAKKVGKTLSKDELHTLASERAMRHVNRVTYSRSTTMFEDMARNMIPFVSAYRQFWAYWTSAFAKHPISMSTALTQYPDVDMFQTLGDYQYLLPRVPFWAPEDPEEETTPLSLARNQLPMASFLVTGPARTIVGLTGGDPNDYASIPMMEGMDATKFAPFSRQARLLYGLSGENMPLSGTVIGESIWGDPDKLNKAHINAVLGQLRYDEKGTGPTIQRDKPLWWRATEDFLGAIGIDAKPEALFAEGAKFALPLTTSYQPEGPRNKSNLLFNYYDAMRRGQTEKAAGMRQKSKFLDRMLTYYDSNEEEKLAMKRDPENAELLMYWVSPYNYDKSGVPYDGLDWQTQFTTGKISRKEEEEYLASIHNMYTDIHGGTYVQSDYRDGGLQYAGDAPRETATKRTKKKLNDALSWAKGIAKYAAKTKGWNYDTLMWQFQNPDKNWGVWPQILKMNGKDPVNYNVQAIIGAFSDKYGDVSVSDPKNIAKEFAKSADNSYKTYVQTMTQDDALRALDLEKWIVSPDLREKFTSETPFAPQLVQAKADQKKAVIKAVVESAAMDKWYWLGSQQLKTVGIDASPKIDMIQLELSVDYEKLKSMKSGTSEYKAARNAYYAKRDKLLSGVKGGAVLAGGLQDRLAALPLVMEAQVTTMGTGRNAVEKQVAYENFLKARDKVLSTKDPDPDRIRQAYEKFVGKKTFDRKQQAEFLRVVAWSFLLANAKHLRYEARNHYSDYYKGKGESAGSKYGKARADELDKVVEALRGFSPSFSQQVDDWFGKDAAIGYRFQDFYNY